LEIDSTDEHENSIFSKQFTEVKTGQKHDKDAVGMQEAIDDLDNVSI
jgi:hypothetical protein